MLLGLTGSLSQLTAGPALPILLNIETVIQYDFARVLPAESQRCAVMSCCPALLKQK